MDTTTSSARQQYLSSLRMGMKVRFTLPVGRTGFTVKTGKVVFNEGTHVVVNMGGRFGTPAVVTADNLILPKA